MAKTMASLQAFPSSPLPRAWSCALIPFPFPFERLPRSLSVSHKKAKTRKRKVGNLWFEFCLVLYPSSSLNYRSLVK